MGKGVIESVGMASSVLLLIPNESYSHDITDLLKEASQNYKRIIYVSANKLYKALQKVFESEEMSLNKFFFIDCITLTLFPESKSPNDGIFTSGAFALTEISLALNKAFSTEEFDCMIFDSLSTLLIYNKSETVSQFVHDQVGRASDASCTAIFTCLESDTDSDLVGKMGLFVDKIIHLHQQT